MNKKGFTLIELLAVIVILGIVVAIAIPGVNIIINNSKQKALQSQVELIQSAAITKLAENPNFNFDEINKDNIKTLLETDSSNFDSIKIRKKDGKIIVNITKDGREATAPFGESVADPYIAFEYQLIENTLDTFLYMSIEEVRANGVYVYEGNYLSNKSKIEDGFRNPDWYLTDLTGNRSLESQINRTTGIYTVVADKLQHNGYWLTHTNVIKTNNTLIGIPHFDLKGLGITNLSMFLAKNQSFNGDISHWDVSEVTDMSGLFYDARSFNRSINNWDISNVISLRETFAYTRDFNQPLNNWNTSNVEEMDKTFFYAQAFDQDVSMWNVTKAVVGCNFSNNSPLRYEYHPPFEPCFT